jgi:hypothetical protein
VHRKFKFEDIRPIRTLWEQMQIDIDEPLLRSSMLLWRITEVDTEFRQFMFKGKVSRDFRLLVFFHKSVSPKHLSIPLRPFRIFSKICGDIRGSRCTTGVDDTGGKWKKSSRRKISIILFGYLWVVELTDIYIFAFKFTLRCLQPDIVLIICHRCQRHRWQICRRCR